MLSEQTIEAYSLAFATRVMSLAETLSVDVFKSAVITLISDYIDFDSAQWVTRARLQDEVGRSYLQGAYLHNLAETKMVDYQPFIQADLLLQAMMQPENWNKAIDLRSIWSDEAYFSSQLYTEYAAKYGLERVVSVLRAREGANFCQAITLYRADRAAVFSELERLFFQQCAHWMSVGLKHTILECVGSSAALGTLRPRAVLDADGFIFEIDAHLENWLNSQVLNYEGAYFPESLLTRFSNENDVLEYSHYRLIRKRHGDLVLIYFHSNLPFQRLSTKEWKVAKLTIKGHSNKRTALELGIEVGTVQKHMQNIYTKLNISELNDNHEKRRLLSVWLSDYLRRLPRDNDKVSTSMLFEKELLAQNLTD